MRIGWLLGWAVPEPWFAAMARAALPGEEHHFFPATAAGLAEIYEGPAYDWIVGYSLGSLLLLGREYRRLTAYNKNGKAMARSKVALLAPIFSFPSEAGLGGRISKVQVRQLSRWLRRDCRGALEDFYRRAELDVSDVSVPPASPEDLLWGLQRLEEDRLEPRLPTGWRAWCGADDKLLDAARLQALAPEVRIVPGATHHPRMLIEAFALEVERVAPNALVRPADVAQRVGVNALHPFENQLRSRGPALSRPRGRAGSPSGVAGRMAAGLPAGDARSK